MIRFREAVMVRFGKFTDYTLSFSDGLQVIYGKNEAGKSTIQLFLKVMLYGVSGGKKESKRLKIRERIIPWENKSAEGVLRFELDGRMLELRRKFGKTSSGDKAEIVDFHTGEEIREFDAKCIGEQILGIPESVFEKTFWIQQGTASFCGEDSDISNRLMNLLETGAEDFSAEGVLEKLEGELKELKAKTKRNKPGEIDRLWALREEKIQERYRLLSERNQRESEENTLKIEKKKLEDLKQEEARLFELAEQKKKISVMDARYKKWKEGERLLSFAEQAESREDYHRFAELDENVIQTAENLESELKKLDSNLLKEHELEKEENLLHHTKIREKNWGLLLFFGVGLILLSALSAVLRFRAWATISILLGIVGVSWTVLCFLKMQHEKNIILQLTDRINIMKSDLLGLKKKADAFAQELNDILLRYKCKNTDELRNGFLHCKQARVEADGYRKAYTSLMEGENPEEFSLEAQNYQDVLSEHADILALDIESMLQKSREKQMDCIATIKESESKLSYVFRENINPADVETEIIHIKDEIENLEKRYKALELAIEVFNKVVEKRKSDFTPLVNEKVNCFLDILTGGKYQDTRVSREYQLRLLPDKTHLYQAEYFSTGTYEQIYFALRLSLATLIGSGTEPLFLDDFLMAYDDERAGLAMKLLSELGKNHQIFFFTCHMRDAENAKKQNVLIRNIEEE